MRLSPAPIAAAMLLLCAVPHASATADASVSTGGASYTVSDQALANDTASHVLVLGEEVQTDSIRAGGLYDYVNGYLTAVVQPALDLVRTHGEACVVGSDPRHGVVCYCIGFDWSCRQDVVPKWVCYASVGPTWGTQAGVVCLPDRASDLLD